jgi:hypothetical protein
MSGFLPSSFLGDSLPCTAIYLPDQFHSLSDASKLNELMAVTVLPGSVEEFEDLEIN